MSDPAACVVVLDGMRTRRTLVASTFRHAGCLVIETASKLDVARTLEANKQSWVLVVVDAAASQAFCDGYPGTPVVHLGGGGHQQRIRNRVTLDTAPLLAAALHSLVGTSGSAN